MMVEPEAGEATFLAERGRLLGLAYRILGSMVDAEDVVQDAWLRWAGCAREPVERPAAWLTTVTTRLALDQLKAARRRREGYVGPWLPEPIVTGAGPEQLAEVADTLTLGFLCLLDRLDPVARAVFLLTDVFGYSSSEVARVVEKSPAACRQIATRARRRMRDAKPARPSAAERVIVDRLFAALMAGDVKAAMALLSPDVVLLTDGGPDRHAARRPVRGTFRVTRFLINVAKRVDPGVTIQPATVNASTGYRLRLPSGAEHSAIACALTDGLVSAIWVVSNPDKLTRMGLPVDLGPACPTGRVGR